jgi:DNA-binding YbaB/EbfC family protein
MFKELGAMMSLLKNQGKIQEEVQKFKSQVGTISAEASTGAGYVTVRVNGNFEVLSVKISEEAMKLGDREVLEDLIAAATNQAIAKVRQQLSEESAKMAANIGLPPGMLGGGLPGMGG